MYLYFLQLMYVMHGMNIWLPSVISISHEKENFCEETWVLSVKYNRCIIYHNYLYLCNRNSLKLMEVRHKASLIQYNWNNHRSSFGLITGLPSLQGEISLGRLLDEVLYQHVPTGSLRLTLFVKYTYLGAQAWN